MKPWPQIRVLIAQYLRLEAQNLERLISPLLFAVTLLLVFTFSFESYDDPQTIRRLFIGEAFVTAFFALQISLARSLEAEAEDGVLELLKAYPVNRLAWFCSKYLVVLSSSLVVFVVTVLAAAFFLAEARVPLLDSMVFLAGFLVLLGSVAIGILLSAMLQGAGAKHILYPLLYFPLTCPVLIAATQACHSYAAGTRGVELWQSWLGLLVIFDIIYGAAAVLLFEELVKPD